MKGLDVITRLKIRSRQVGDCMIWHGKTTGKTNGYGSIWYKGKDVRIGRLICHLYHGADLNDSSWVAAHKPECTSSLCWIPEHLYPTSPHQNVQDQIAAGTFKDGRANLNGGENYNKEKADKNRRNN